MTTIPKTRRRRQSLRRLAVLSSWVSVLAAAFWLTMLGSGIGRSNAFAVTLPTKTGTLAAGFPNHNRCETIAGTGVCVGVVARASRKIFAAASTRLHNARNENNSSSSNNNDDLLEKARKLREEASLLEDDLRARPKRPASSESSSSSSSLSPPVVVRQLEGSTWTVSYRFSSQPAPKKQGDGKNDPSPQQQQQPKKTFYSGKLTLLLKADGYSERIIAEDDDNNNDNNDNDIRITKIWGWDKETSNEDDLDYLLFSMDVTFPDSDPETPGATERYYLQARIEDENNGGVVGARGSIALKEGTITVKKDVTETTGGMWGFFNVAGILTEFRYCGDFAARPAAPPREA